MVRYATHAGGTIAVTLINKEHWDKARPRTVRVRLDRLAAAGAEAIFLRARNDDIASGPADVTLGGALIEAERTLARPMDATDSGQDGWRIVLEPPCNCGRPPSAVRETLAKKYAT